MVININPRYWCRPAQLARELGISKQALNSRIKAGTIRAWYIKDLDLTLVKR